MNIPTKKQHYVPRFLLRRFRIDTKESLWTFDKLTGKKFVQNVADAGHENSFYDLTIAGETITAEKFLAERESIWAALIDGIVSRRSLAELTPVDYEQIAQFLAVQFVRTKQHRERFREMGEAFRAELLRRRERLSKEVEEQLAPPDEQTLKLHTLQSIQNCLRYVPHLLDKKWLLFETTPADPLFISDSPIGLDNDEDHGPYGTLGLAARGIQISLPLSPTLGLALYCPSILYDCDQKIVRYEIQNRGQPPVKAAIGLRRFVDHALMGIPISLEPANVERLNSIQVKFAHRFLFSFSNEFGLVERMIKRHPHMKSGPKITVN